MEYHTRDCHIEECWQRDPPLGRTVVHPELRAMIPIFPDDHLLVLSELCQEYLNLQARPVPLQGL